MAWGKHLIVDCAACKEGYRSEAAIAQFARELVRRIDMVAYGEPQVNHFGHACPSTSGFTLIQLIETSNITAHFCDDSGDAYFDVFSCKDFDTADALRVIKEFFDPERTVVTEISRQAPSEADMIALQEGGATPMEVEV